MPSMAGCSASPTRSSCSPRVTWRSRPKSAPSSSRRASSTRASARRHVPPRRRGLRADVGLRLHDPDRRLHPEFDVLPGRRALALQPRPERGDGLPARRLRAVPADLPEVPAAARPARPQSDGRHHRAQHRGLDRREPHRGVTPQRAWGRAGLVLVGVLLVDQVTKRLVQSGIAQGERDGVFPGVELVHVRNRGVAFGAFAGGGTVVAVVIGVALVALVLWFMRHARKDLAWLPTGLLFGGAIGNVFDRVRDGAVTDFIMYPAWPALNVADIEHTFGVLSLLY